MSQEQKERNQLPAAALCVNIWPMRMYFASIADNLCFIWRMSARLRTNLQAFREKQVLNPRQSTLP